MRKIFLLLFVYLLSTHFCLAQEPTLDWAFRLGGINSTECTGSALAQDSLGNLYTLGTYYSGEVDFDHGPGNYSLVRPLNVGAVYLLKSDQNGNFLWVKDWLSYESIGFTVTEMYNVKMAVDAAGYIYLTGGLSHTIDFDPGPGVVNLSSDDGAQFIMKLDPNGNFLWAKQIAGNMEMNAITTDNNGNILLTGTYYYEAVDFDPGPGIFNMSPTGYSSAFILKLNNDGLFTWVKSGGANFTRSYGITTDMNGAVYTTGAFPYTIDFDPGPGVFNQTAFFNPSVGEAPDAYICKLDSSGNFVWANRLGGLYEDDGLFLKVDKTGTLYAAGLFAGDITLSPVANPINLGYAGSYDTYICKINNEGAFVWARRIGGGSDDGVKKIEFDTASNIYLLGSFNGTADFVPMDGSHHNLTAVANADIYVCKLDSNGIFKWARQFGGTDYQYGSEAPGGMIVDKYANIYGTGRFDGTSDFDPDTSIYNLTCSGIPADNPVAGTNTYMFKWRQCDPPAIPLNTSIADSLSVCPGESTTLTASGSGTLGWYSSALNGTYLGNGPNFITPVLYASTTFYVQDSTCSASVGRRPIVVTVKQLSSASVSITACNSFTLNSQTYTSTGIFTQILTNAAGCDSVLTLHLQINNTVDTMQDVSICAGETFHVGSEVYSNSGTYHNNFTAANGCDSNVTTHLVVESLININVTVTDTYLKADQLAASYQWIDCSNANMPIAGETGQTFIPLFNGSYAVIISNGNCIDTSECIYVSRPGNDVTIFPNPNNGHFSILLSNMTGPAEIVIYNSAGQTVFKRSNVLAITPVDLSKFSDAVYWVRILQDNKTLVTKKVVKL